MSPGDDVCDGVDRYGVTVWYFNDVERQQARQRYALQGTVTFPYSLTIVLFREVVKHVSVLFFLMLAIGRVQSIVISMSMCLSVCVPTYSAVCYVLVDYVMFSHYASC